MPVLNSDAQILQALNLIPLCEKQIKQAGKTSYQNCPRDRGVKEWGGACASAE